MIYREGDRLAIIHFLNIVFSTTLLRAGRIRSFAPFIAKVGSRCSTFRQTSSITIAGDCIAQRSIKDWAAIGPCAAGLCGLVRSLVVELKPVCINVMQPGGVATHLWRDMKPDVREALYRRWKESLRVEGAR
jgi:NAD(P)-dependent dehydrogenase (short-subunit alcohol dehydrogenase family)